MILSWWPTCLEDSRGSRSLNSTPQSIVCVSNMANIEDCYYSVMKSGLLYISHCNIDERNDIATKP